MNLLTEPIISVDGRAKLSLPQLFSAMARHEVRHFPALRAYQRPAWHMFLVQLAAIAVWRSENRDVPCRSNEWATLLRNLTPEVQNDGAWCLIGERAATPAFMQSPDPGGLNWNTVATPDDLDILITSRNHDVKQSIARTSTPEDWVFALVSLQTTAGYDGSKNYGIARMNRGSSSRPMLGLSPAAERDLRVDPSKWWLRDVHQLLERRRRGKLRYTIGREDGSALLWCLEWPEGDVLEIGKLEPWFIEVARRVRIVGSHGHMTAMSSNSISPRINAESRKGNVEDPWAPINKKEGKSFTLGSGDFNYRTLHELVLNGDWKLPELARLGDTEKDDDLLLVAEALSRGNAKTEGFKSRIVPVPRGVAALIFRTPDAGALSSELIDEIGVFDKALRDSIALLAAGGEFERDKRRYYPFTRQARNRFDRIADSLFFPSLWKRLDAQTSSPHRAVVQVKQEFIQSLHEAAQEELEFALPEIPCPAISRPKAEARCRRVFRLRIRSKFGALPQSDSDGEPDDDERSDSNS